MSSKNPSLSKVTGLDTSSSSKLVLPSLKASKPTLGITSPTLSVVSPQSSPKAANRSDVSPKISDEIPGRNHLIDLLEKCKNDDKDSSETVKPTATNDIPQKGMLDDQSKDDGSNNERIRANLPDKPRKSEMANLIMENHKPGTKEDISTHMYGGAGAILDESDSSSKSSFQEKTEKELDSSLPTKLNDLTLKTNVTVKACNSNSKSDDEFEKQDAEQGKQSLLHTDTISLNGGSDSDTDSMCGSENSSVIAHMGDDFLNGDPKSNEGKSVPSDQLIDLPTENTGSSNQLQRASTNMSFKVPNPPKDNKKQPDFDFQSFLDMFKSSECQPLRRYLRSFLFQFGQRKWTVDEEVKVIKDFEEFMMKKMVGYFPFNTLQKDEDINNCKEGLEKLVMTRVYSQVFSPLVASNHLDDQLIKDRRADKQYAYNVRLYDWIKLQNLDVPIEISANSKFVKLAAKELNKINRYKAPRDKIICILNCCKIIFGLIRQQQKEKQIEENADSFVPLLICVLLNAKVKCLPSNLAYIERFRNSDFLIGEASYYVSTLQIACDFVRDVSRGQLTITDEEYERNMKESRTKLEKELSIRRKQNAQPIFSKKLTDLISQASSESPSEVLTKSAAIMKQSISNSFNNFIQGVNDTSKPVPEHSKATKKKTMFANDKQLEQIKSLSLQEHNLQLKKEQRTKEILNDLQNMFPDIEGAIIEDVLNDTVNEDEDASNIGDCVDALLVLSSN